MKTWVRIVYLIVAAVFFLRAGTSLYNYFKKPAPTPEPVVLESPSPKVNLYTNTILGYSFNLPAGWQESTVEGSATGDVAFTPGPMASPLGTTTTYLAITTKGMDTGPSSTLEEFRSWGKIDADDPNNETAKIEEMPIGGHAAILLETTPSESYDWAGVAWFMRGDLNYYITAQGVGDATPEDLTALYDLYNSFRFAK